MLVVGYSTLFIGLVAIAVSTAKETFDAFCYIVLWALFLTGVLAIHVMALLTMRRHVRVHSFDSRRGILTLWFRNTKYVDLVHEFRKLNP